MRKEGGNYLVWLRAWGAEGSVTHLGNVITHRGPRRTFLEILL